jgi:hypothetical protein
MIIVQNAQGDILCNSDGDVMVFKSAELARISAVVRNMTQDEGWKPAQLPRLPLSLPGEFN